MLTSASPSRPAPTTLLPSLCRYKRWILLAPATPFCHQTLSGRFFSALRTPTGIPRQSFSRWIRSALIHQLPLEWQLGEEIQPRPERSIHEYVVPAQHRVARRSRRLPTQMEQSPLNSMSVPRLASRLRAHPQRELPLLGTQVNPV